MTLKEQIARLATTALITSSLTGIVLWLCLGLPGLQRLLYILDLDK